MPEIWEFINRVLTHWLFLLFGVVLPMVGLYERWKGVAFILPASKWKAIGMCFLMYAFYLAWRDEYRAKTELGNKLEDIESCQRTDIQKIKTILIPQITLSEKSPGFIYGQKSRLSQNSELPYVHEIVIKTTEEKNPTAILINYVGELGGLLDVSWTFAELPGELIVSNTYTCIIRGEPSSYLIGFRNVFEPNLPIVVKMFSKEKIQVTSIRRTPYQWK